MSFSPSDDFTTTNWSLILEAADALPERALKALNRLCTRYRTPIYAFIRQQGADHHRAEDMTQGFFEFAIRNSVIQRAKREKGRFRSFILASLRNFLFNLHDSATAAKRGGGIHNLSLDEIGAENIAAPPEGTHPTDPSFDRAWAKEVISQTMAALKDYYARRGFSAIHDALRPHLTGNPTREEYSALAAELDLSVNATEVALIRMRRRFGKLLRAEVSQTVAHPDDIAAEIRFLLSVLASE